MRNNRLFATGFRNFESIEIDPAAESILFMGQCPGKTNLIEAVWQFTGAKSFRQSKKTRFAGFGKEKALLEISFFNEKEISWRR